MVKKSKRSERRNQISEIEDLEQQADSKDSDGDEVESVDSDIKVAATAVDAPDGDDIQQKFGLKAINDKEGLLERLKEVKENFYNRLDSVKLIKKQGKIPFTEHMTVSGDEAI